ncbi:MAG: hypothetical protein WA708_15990 [Acidobacteriaceae bacterium]
MHKPLTVLAIFVLLSSTVARAKHTCIAPDKALQHVDKNVCIAAHVYRVVDATDGVHFLDVCSPQTSDADCHFFILSFSRDEKSVGSLQKLVNQDIKIRGTVNTIQGRAVVVLSSKGQLHGGKEKFHPNPRLVQSFSAENGGQGFSARNGTMGQRGVHFHHRGN